jgi:hypothetical protein
MMINVAGPATGDGLLPERGAHSMSQFGRHEAPDSEVADPAAARPGLRAELADAVTARTVAMVAAVLLLQLGFILSYVGAFHSPKPHHISLAVIAPTQAAENLNGIAGHLIVIASYAVVGAAIALTASALRTTRPPATVRHQGALPSRVIETAD